MLKKRIIPILLFRDQLLFKGVKFNSWRNIGSLLPAVKIYNLRDVDELIILNIDGYKKNHNFDYEFLTQISRECRVPLTIGGGVDSVDKASSILNRVADKVAVNSAAYKNISLIEKIASRHGSQSVVASVDVKVDAKGRWSCYSHGGTVRTDYDLMVWVKVLESQGAGEVLITSIDHEGCMEGFDLELVDLLRSGVDIPVILAGGCGHMSHAFAALSYEAISAVGISSYFQFTENTPSSVNLYLKQNGIPVRSLM